jgi:serine/threonine protein phosphatase PrpC
MGSLSVSLGQHSSRGRKDVNQDFHGACIPKAPLLASKGVVVAVADGIGSSAVSQVASEAAVRGLIDDYYCTSEAWSVKRSAERVLTATNSWLHAQTRRSDHRFDPDRGYVCTLSALILKSNTAHLFHVGDTRIGRLQGSVLEPLTQDHRTWVSAEQSYLSRALGFAPGLDLDYQALAVQRGDIFVLSSDGVHDHIDGDAVAAHIEAHAGQADQLDRAAYAIAQDALQRGSTDNLTVQLVRIDDLPEPQAQELLPQREALPLPPLLLPRAEFDGYRIQRELHASHRSHIYLAQDIASGEQVVLKTPAIDLQQDAAALDRFMLEEWVARRIQSAHVLKAQAPTRERRYLYVAMEYLQGHSVAQWMAEHPKPTLDEVRRIVVQVAKGLQAFHRLEMLHGDLRPENLMLDASGTVKIIDFGATRVAGLVESTGPGARAQPLGALPFMAPEYFLGEEGSERSDLYSLAVITYHLLGGQLPFGAQVARTRMRAEQLRLRYAPLRERRPELPAWIDAALERATHPDPAKRHEALSAFVQELHQPSADFLRRARPALAERNPVLFWKAVSILLGLVVVVLIGVMRFRG